MKKIIFILLISVITIFSQQKEKIVLKDSTLFKSYNNRLMLYSQALQSRAIYLANQDSTCKAIKSVMGELEFLLNEEIKRQTKKDE